MRFALGSFGLSVLLIACGSADRPASGEGTSDATGGGEDRASHDAASHDAASDDTASDDAAPPPDEGPIAEVPFPAEQIRAATPVGRTYVFRFDEDGAQRFERWVFERVDERGYVSTSTPVDEAGQPVGEPERSEGTWEELERHAHFPLDQTTIQNARLGLPIGNFRCQLYVVTAEENGQSVLSRFWFATDLPGAPVRMVREVDGEPVLTMMLVDHEPPIER